MVLYNRLKEKLENKNVISQPQGAFCKNFRRADHIAHSLALLKKYIKNGQYLYTCFVDFRKAFDSVWREDLMNKLGKTGITGKFLKVGNSMYESTSVSLIFKDNSTK